MNKKLTSAVALVCTAAMCVPFAACSPEQEAASYVTMDINPAIELTLDKHNKVISVYGANEDGQVLLYGEDGIIGADVEVAVDKITALAVQLGYLSEENSVVQTSVTSSSSVLAESVLGKVNAKISITADSFNLSVQCEGAEAYSLLRKLETLKENFPDNEKIQALTAEKLNLVLSAVEALGVSVEEAVEMTDKQLIAAVSEAHKQFEEYATAAYNKAKTVASSAYDIAVGAAVDGVYATYYATHALSHTDTAYYGVLYNAYKTSARALNATASGLIIAEKAAKYPLNNEQTAAVAEALGVTEDLSVLKNSDGDITLESVYAYADKAFKNSETVNEIKTKLDAALDTVESQIAEYIESISAEYGNEITSVKEKVTAAANSLQTFVTDILPESVKNAIADIKADMGTLADKLTAIAADGVITADEVREVAATFETLAAQTLSKIEKDLSKSELEKIEEQKQKIIDGLTAAKAQFESAVKTAEDQAKARLEELKAARTAQNA